MARTDNAWGICLLFGIAAAISFLCKDGYNPRTVDVCYDARSIKIAQEQALRETFQRECAWIMRYVARRGLVKYRSVPHLRRFTPVPKPPDDAEPDKFQDGTQTSHYLCQQSRDCLSDTLIAVKYTFEIPRRGLKAPSLSFDYINSNHLSSKQCRQPRGRILLHARQDMRVDHEGYLNPFMS
jgi:hypothetical protein